MEIKLEVPEYDRQTGLRCKWENGFEICVKMDDDIVTLSANKEGLRSLANHLLNLSQESVPAGCHFHFDENNSLEKS